MIEGFIRILQWFRVIGLQPEDIAGVNITVEFPNYFAASRAYRALLEACGSLKPQETIGLSDGHVARICGLNLKITNRH